MAARGGSSQVVTWILFIVLVGLGVLLWRTHVSSEKMMASYEAKLHSMGRENERLSLQLVEAGKEISKVKEESTSYAAKLRDEFAKERETLAQQNQKLTMEKRELDTNLKNDLSQCKESLRQMCGKLVNETRLSILRVVHDKVNAQAVTILSQNGISLDGFHQSKP